MQDAAAEIIPLPLLAAWLPDRPDPKLDRVLDATVVSISRHGLSKTSLSDIAREMAVAPSTVYRKVGTVANAALMIMAREGHRLVERIPEIVDGYDGPQVITVFLAASVEHTRAHPMVVKILQDEDIWVGRVATRRLDEYFRLAAAGTAPLLASAMESGHIRRQDPELLAHWIVRIGLSCIASPPPGDLRRALDALLLPALTPDLG